MSSYPIAADKIIYALRQIRVFTGSDGLNHNVLKLTPSTVFNYQNKELFYGIICGFVKRK